MICPECQGKGIVTASDGADVDPRDWNGDERRQQPRWTGNAALNFSEAQPSARYQSCPNCDGSGKTHPNLLHVH